MDRNESRRNRKPLPNKGEVVVEVHAVGLNPVDYKTATNGNPH
jgi:NADPH:quinone reductase-like Zn-dependent oxidoreductase